MTAKPPLLLQQVVAAIDASPNPSDTFSGMMVYFLSGSLKSLTYDDIEESIGKAFSVVDNRLDTLQELQAKQKRSRKA